MSVDIVKMLDENYEKLSGFLDEDTLAELAVAIAEAKTAYVAWDAKMTAVRELLLGSMQKAASRKTVV